MFKQIFKIFTVIICIISFACAITPYNSKIIEGVYFNRINPHMELSFNQGEFLLTDYYSQSIYTQDCCDTISFGFWRKEEGNFISLTSPEKFRTNYMNMKVEEKLDSSLTGLKFIIKNQMEKYYDSIGQDDKFRKYELRLNSNYFSDLSEITHDSSIIVIDDYIIINEFEINISIDKKIPLNNLGINYIYTIPYKTKNVKSNTFIINLPDLNLSYLSHRRLNQDYLKVLNDSTLYWDGEYFDKNK